MASRGAAKGAGTHDETHRERFTLAPAGAVGEGGVERPQLPPRRAAATAGAPWPDAVTASVRPARRGARIKLPSCAVPVDYSDAIAVGGTHRVVAFGRPIVLARNAFGELFAMGDECPHQGASLSQGEVVGSRLRCLYHGAEYHRDGTCVSAGGQRGNTTFDVSEVNGVVFLGPRGLPGALDVTDGMRIPFVDEMTPGGFAPALTIRQRDVIHNDFSLVYDNIVSVEHLVGVHRMVPSRNQKGGEPDTVSFEQPLTALGRKIFGSDFLDCIVHMRPPFASFVEQRFPSGLRAQIFMFAVPSVPGRQSELLTVWRQNFLDEAKLPGRILQAIVRELLFRPLVKKAVREDREVIEAQIFRSPAERAAEARRERARLLASRAGGAGRAGRAEASAPSGRVLVLGASGRTGRHLVDELLDAGHRVTALVRDLGHFPTRHIRLDVRVGDILSPEAVRAAMQGQQSVVMAVGGRRGGGPKDVCARATRYVVEAMASCGVERLVAVTSYGLGNTRPFMATLMGLPYEHMFFRLAMGAMLDDKARQEAIIRASGLNWTLLRPRQLVDGADHRVVARADGSSVGKRVSRQAVAHFAREVLSAGEAHRKAYALSVD